MNFISRIDEGCSTHRVSSPWRNINRGDEKPLPETLLRHYDPEDLVVLSHDTLPRGSWRERFWQNQGQAGLSRVQASPTGQPAPAPVPVRAVAVPGPREPGGACNDKVEGSPCALPRFLTGFFIRSSPQDQGTGVS